MKITELKENPDNPQSYAETEIDNLVRSIKDFPKMMALRPIVYDSVTLYVLGGNKRLKALQKAGYKELPDEWVKSADELTEEEKHRFIISDNIVHGSWDYEMLAEKWNKEQLEDWGMDISEWNINPDELGEDFNLQDGEKEAFQQMAFTLADEQAEVIKNAIQEIKKTDEYKYAETMGNENSNGNALYLIIMQWKEMNS